MSAGRVLSSWNGLAPTVVGQVHARGGSMYVQPLSSAISAAAHSIEEIRPVLAALFRQLDG